MIPALALKALLAVGVPQRFAKYIFWGILGLLIAAAAFFAWRAIDQHYQHIAQLERDNATLSATNDKLNAAINDLSKVNADNLKARELAEQQMKDNQLVATANRKAEQDRKADLRSIRDAINSTPAADRHAVSPVIRSTVDRLWPKAAGGHAH